MTAKDAHDIEQTVTRRERTVDVICCSKTYNLSVTITARTVTLLTRSMFTHGGDSRSVLRRVPLVVTIISLDLEVQ